MPRAPFTLTTGFLVVAFASPAFAQTSFRELNPGSMGPNALPTVPNADPEIEAKVRAELQFATQFESSTDDASVVPYFKVVVPIVDRAAVETWGTPVELWQVSRATRDARGTPNRSGVSRGDLYFGGRFLFLRESGWVPDFGARYVVKTTTGKSFEDRRFTDAPAYLIDALFGKDVYSGSGSILRARVLMKLGFLAWQQVEATQNDALDYGLTAQLSFAAPLRLDLEWRGYYGGQTAAADAPNVLGATFVFEGTHVDWVTTLNHGLSDAPEYEIRTGLAAHFDATVLPWSSLSGG